jgi:hypothetical protein
MTPLLFIVFALAFVILISRAGRAQKKSKHEAFPVTIISPGKTVTVDGYDRERLRKELEAATAQLKPVLALAQNGPAHTERERMTVAITGTLSEPRAQVAIKINSTKNARFVERVAGNTDYLVAARHDTAKARAAAQNGTVVLTEQQLTEYLESGEFPHHQRRYTYSGFNFDESEIVWAETLDPPLRCRLEYADSAGEHSKRTIDVLHPSGIHPNGREYMAAFEDGQLKTFRKDRILKLERKG